MNCIIKNKQYAITISYGDYTCGVGGTDKSILSQQKVLNSHDISILHLSPKLIMGRKRVGSMDVWSLLNDGCFVGVCDVISIVKLIKSLQEEGCDLLGFIIHHLNNVCIEDLIEILDVADVPIYFYLHDYYTICPATGLVRNKSEFCGFSFPDKNKCSGCSSFDVKLCEQSKQVEELINHIKAKTTFVAPSKTVFDNWLRVYPNCRDRMVLFPHQIPMGQYTGNMDVKDEKEPIRIAYVGYQSPYKGWYEWVEAATQAYGSGNNYDFYQMGKYADSFEFIHEVKVDFSNDIDSMTKALRANNIDCAVIWSVIPETYSYTLYESYSANCFILTNCLSGNVAALVKEWENGIVAQDRHDLKQLLLDENKLRDTINAYKMSKRYGPERLEDNEAIVELLFRNKQTAKIREVRYSFSGLIAKFLLNLYTVALKVKRSISR